MTDYTKTTDFTSKDSLPSGDSGKIIRGAEFGTEFDNIQTAVNSKSNIENPSFTGNITVTGTVDGRDIAADGTKLDTIETSADVTDTANVTAAGAVMDSELTDITAVKALNQGVATTDSPTFAAVTSTGNVTVGGTVDGRDVAADGTKLDGIEAGATADQTAAQIKTAYESNADTNAFTDADHTKLDSIEASADVTDATNVTAAGALMDSEVTNLAQVKAFDSADYATAAQGTTADAALPKTGGAMTGAITTNSTFDGRNVATDGTKLDGIEALADVTDTANVTAAGALMDSELTSEASVKALNQGVATTDSPTFAGATVNGTVEFDGLSGTGAVTVTDILDQDDMSGNSATALATQQSIKSYVDSQVATSDTLAEVLANGNATGGTDVAFGDNDKAIFGAGSDLQIYHSGSHSFITDAGTGDLYIGASNNIALMNAAFSENKLLATTDGALKLYYDGSEKLATTSTGIDVSGTATMDGLTVDGNTALNNTSAGTTVATLSGQYSGSGDVKLLAFQRNGGAVAGAITYADASTGIEIGTTTSHTLALTTGDTQRLRIGNNGDISFYEDTGTTAKLFWDASEESLGIGTSSPSAKLSLQTATGANNTSYNIIDATTDNPTYKAQINLVREDSSGKLGWAFLTNNVGSPTERMRIDSSGRVGIGTSSPDTSLHISEPSTATATVRLEQTDTTLVADQAVGVIEFEQNDAAGVGVPAKFGAFGENANAAVGLRFYTGTGATANERMRIDSSGNVGIGTGSPTDKLHVSGTASVFKQQNNVTNWTLGLDAADQSYKIKHNGTERMRIDSSGNLLVGTTSTNPAGGTGVGIQLNPIGQVNTSRSGGASGVFNRTTSDGEIIQLKKDGTTVGSIGSNSGAYLYIASANDVGGIGFYNNSLRPVQSSGSGSDADQDLGNSTTRWRSLYLSSQVYANYIGTLDDTNTTISFPGSDQIRFNNGGSERARIDASGNLLVGTTTQSARLTVNNGGANTGVNIVQGSTTTNYVPLNIHNDRVAGGVTARMVRFQAGDSTQVGSIDSTVTATTYNTSSDQRLKDNIVDAPSASDDIDAIQVRSFDWKADGSHQKYGMVAQELQGVAPEAVSVPEDSEDMMGVDYSKLVPMLVKEIQSLRARVAQLETN